jgi:16S rRNA C967 or C1407 C5-methylase (RsmB/RsmF family)
MSTDRPRILKLQELEVPVQDSVRNHLAKAYVGLYHDREDGALRQANRHLDRVLRAMKTAPGTNVCRVNTLLSTREKVVDELEKSVREWIKRCGAEGILSCTVAEHELFDDVVCIDIKRIEKSRKKRKHEEDDKEIFAHWPRRRELGWPMTHRCVLVDRFCGEAVLRGADIFVKGILSADMGIQEGEEVAVYADCPVSTSASTPCRGLRLEQFTGRCVYLGRGTALCKRADFFSRQAGPGVQVLPLSRAEPDAPILPPLSGILSNSMVLQNLPSVVVAHALLSGEWKKDECILDMCAAPGGKTSHLASLTNNNLVTIVACDKSHKKIITASKLFQRLGAASIVPLALDSSDCVHHDVPPDQRSSVQDILASAEKAKNGLLNVKRFFPESFDRILLDPPCSALGLRPKLQIPQSKVADLEAIASYQRRFIREAVALLKPGGVMSYSTCTIHSLENEEMVRHILDKYPGMELVPIDFDIGQPGLPGLGLDEHQCRCIRRFDPTDKTDTIGFFVAKFRKKNI